MPVTAPANADGKTIVNLTSTAAGVWTVSTGTLWLNAGATTPYAGTSITSVYWKVGNLTGTAQIACGAAQASTSVMAVFPGKIQYGSFAWNEDRAGIVTGKTRSGKTVGRVLGDGQFQRLHQVGCKNANRTDALELLEFGRLHYPGLIFRLTDDWSGLAGYFQLASPVKATVNSIQRIDWSADLIQMPNP